MDWIKRLTFLILLCIATPLTVVASAVEISAPQNVSLDDTFIVEVSIDTEADEINLISGELVLPEALEIVDISTGSSIISFWHTLPAIKAENLNFSGIVPGGFKGKGEIFSLLLHSKEEGEFNITAQNVEVYLNDGFGTLVSSSVVGSSISSLNSNEGLLESFVKDLDAPEPFQIDIVRSEDVFDNKYFLIFSANDKGSGVSYYEVQEGSGEPRERDWRRESSPYVLKNQSIASTIFVKAVDRAGNSRIERIDNNETNSTQGKVALTVVFLVALCFSTFVYVSNLRQKNRRKNK